MKQKSFKVYIQRTLKSVLPALHITKSGLEALDSLIRTTAKQMVDRSLVLTTEGGKKTLSLPEVKASLSLTFPSELAARSDTFANNAAANFVQSEAEREKSETSEKVQAQTRESRCGLIFSVSAAEKYLRLHGHNGYNHVSATAPVYLAAVLQFLTEEVIRLTGVEVATNGKITMSVRHLFLALSKDAQLSRLISTLRLVFLEGGVEPHIEEKFLEKKKRKRLNVPVVDANGVKRAHRWRPGTKTLMEIRRLQKDGDLLMQRAPFSRLIREAGSSFYNDEFRYTKDFITSLQSYVEDRLIRLMRCANKVTLHASRETVYAEDVTLTRELVEPNLVVHEFTSSIPQAALRKMALRAGIKRYGDDSTVVYSTLVHSYVYSVMRDVVVCARLHKVQTLNTKLLLESLEMRGVHLSINAQKRRVTNRKNTDSTETESEANSVEESDVSDVEEDVEEAEELETINE